MNIRIEYAEEAELSVDFVDADEGPESGYEIVKVQYEHGEYRGRPARAVLVVLSPVAASDEEDGDEEEDEDEGNETDEAALFAAWQFGYEAGVRQEKLYGQNAQTPVADSGRSVDGLTGVCPSCREGAQSRGPQFGNR